MATSQIITLLVLAAVITALIWDKVRADVVALAGAAVLLVTGVVRPVEVQSAFASPAIVAVASLFVIAYAMELSGLLDAAIRRTREHLENEYRTLELPFEPITAPPFAMKATWDLRGFTDYVGTWSAVQRYAKARGEDPIPELFHSLSRLWGPDERVVTWPLYLKVGRVGK